MRRGFPAAEKLEPGVRALGLRRALTADAVVTRRRLSVSAPP